MSTSYKPTGTSNLYAEEFRLEKLSKQGDPLERLNKVINWEYFRTTIEKVIGDKLVQAGPRRYDPILMFKILIIQRYYNLSDEQLEYQILDRLSFCRFLGLSLADRVPDEKTIWKFRETLVKKGLAKKLFEKFNALLEQHGLIAQEGKIIDASFVEAPRQRNSREENAKIKEGQTPSGWDENPHKKRQKDVDGRWTKKNNETHYGYKNHIKVDNKHKLIDKYAITHAAVHDSQALDALLEEKDENQNLWADSAYTGADQEKTIKSYRVNNQVHEKGYKNRPLTEEQKQSNTNKSKVRARIEHVFGFMEQSMNKLYIRSIGTNRAKGFAGLLNLTYNLFRYEQIVRLDGISVSSWN